VTVTVCVAVPPFAVALRVRLVGDTVSEAASVLKDHTGEAEDPAAFLATTCQWYDPAAVIPTAAVRVFVVFVRKGGGFADPK